MQKLFLFSILLLSLVGTVSPVYAACDHTDCSVIKMGNVTITNSGAPTVTTLGKTTIVTSPIDNNSVVRYTLPRYAVNPVYVPNYGLLYNNRYDNNWYYAQPRPQSK